MNPLVFAEAVGVDPLWLGVASVVSAVLTAAAGALASLLRDRREAGRTNRADAMSEWQEIVNQLQGRVDQLTAEVSRLHDERGECREENAALRYEVRMLREEIAELKRA